MLPAWRSELLMAIRVHRKGDLNFCIRGIQQCLMTNNSYTCSVRFTFKKKSKKSDIRQVNHSALVHYQKKPQKKPNKLEGKKASIWGHEEKNRVD